MFEPIRTQRLLLRPFRRDDVDALVERRNESEVARLQNWVLPFTRSQAEDLVESLLAMDGPADGEWWMLVVADPETDAPLGDLALNLSWGGRCSEIGYTLASEHWGKGYATEAVDALVDWLFDVQGVTRVSGTLHPDNVASAMVLERTGFVFEGHTRLSYWVGDDNSDDWIYGQTRTDREEWRERPFGPPDDVALVEITPGSNRDVLSLQTHKTQERFVAPMAASFADALFPEIVDGHPVAPWMRAIEADGELAGFVMLALRTEHDPEPFLWRLLIDRRHQRRGIGVRTLELVAAQCRTRGESSLLTSWAEGRGTPAPFYRGFGFEPTGRLVDGEVEARLHLG